MIDLPYFDLILEGREKKDALAAAFSSYVHWGYWDEPGKARGDDGDFAVAMEKLNGEVLAEARLSDGQAVVDCGCGFGGTLGAIAAQKKNMKLTGVNVDARQLAVAKSQVRGGVTWVEADACALPFPDKSFDRALAVECIFHFPSRLRFLKEAARVLKPGGVLALSDFVPVALSGGGFLGRWLEGEIAKGYGPVSGWPDGGYSTMAAAAGLEIVSDRDVSAHIMPTYPIVIGVAGRAGRNDLVRSTRWLHWASLLRLVRYRILSFRKP